MNFFKFFYYVHFFIGKKNKFYQITINTKIHKEKTFFKTQKMIKKTTSTQNG